jgi:predicted nucleic acid-binding protein
VDVAVDSSVLVALLVPNDVWHPQAIELQDALVAVDATFVYFDCVAAESISVATRRLSERGLTGDVQAFMDRLDVLIDPQHISWIFPEVPRLYDDVFALVRSSNGALNFNDALIALSCRERSISAIASFDADFDGIDWLDRFSTPGDLSR